MSGIYRIIVQNVFCKDEKQTQPHEEAEVTDFSPVLFDDSPASTPCPSGSEGGTGDKFEVFGTSVEEAVRELRFRIEQKTMLTASAGEGKLWAVPNRTLSFKICIIVT